MTDTRRTLFALARVVSSATILFGALAAGCQDSATVWSTERISPNGQWIAAARTTQYGGPGNAALISTVTLRRVQGRKGEIEILTVWQEKHMDIGLQWLTPSHLEIVYKQPATIEFQVTKCAGIDISVRDL